jgi:hypothetical protein
VISLINIRHLIPPAPFEQRRSSDALTRDLRNRMATAGIDPEKDMATATAGSMRPSGASSTANNINGAPVSNQHTPLELFQLLIGITTPSYLDASEDADAETPLTMKARGKASLRTNSNPNRRYGNVGLYDRAKRRQRRCRRSYLLTSYIGNTLYMLQIILAAAFTALSAYKRTSPIVLTVLGAVNTVVAG